jgi:hypothetical protein
MTLPPLIRRAVPAALLALAAACARELAGPTAGRMYRATVHVVPVLPSVAGRTGTAGSVYVDSITVAITNAHGDTLGFVGVAFPQGQDSVVVSIPVKLDSATQTVTARVDILANGQIVFHSQAQIEASVGASTTSHVDSIPLEAAIWSQFQGVAEVALPGRIGFTAAYDTGMKEIVGFGGATPAGLTGETWVLPARGGWKQVGGATAPAARLGQAMAYDAGRGVTVLFGGATASGFTNETWEFTASTAAWTQITTTGAPSARGFGVLAYDAARGRLVLFGGHDGNNFLNETWEYNGATKAWTKVSTASSPPARAGHQMAYSVSLGRTVLFGGVDASLHALNDTWTYNGATWTQVAVASAPSVRAAHGMAYDPAGARVLLFGGADTKVDLSNPSPANDQVRHNDVWAFNGTAWTPLSADGAAGAPSKRAGMAVVYDVPRARLVVISGLAAGTLESDTWVWDGTTWTQTATAPLVARSQPGMVFDTRRGVTIMFGGTGADSVTWQFDGLAWRPVAFAGPGARSAPAMAYDSASGLVVLFGGARGGSPLADTWVFDGTVWANVATTGAPPARSGAAMAFDFWRRKVVMFGGLGATGALADTWEYNIGTKTWTQVTGAGAPPARSGGAVTFDQTLGKVVLFGGAGAGPLADTWTYNGTVWTQVTTATAPSARSGAAMAYEGSRAKSVLFGGTSSLGGQNDMWRFDGTGWAQLYPATSPSARTSAGMVYDWSRGYVVLFGGATASGTASGDVADTWLFR